VKKINRNIYNQNMSKLFDALPKTSMVSPHAGSVDGFIDFMRKYVYVPASSDAKIGQFIPINIHPKLEEIVRHYFAYKGARHKFRVVFFCTPKGWFKTIILCAYCLWRADQHPNQLIIIMGTKAKGSKQEGFDTIKKMLGFGERSARLHDGNDYFATRGVRLIESGDTPEIHFANGSVVQSAPCVDSSVQGPTQINVIYLSEFGDVVDRLGIQAQQNAIASTRGAANDFIIGACNFPKAKNVPAIGWVKGKPPDGRAVFWRSAKDVTELIELDSIYAPHISPEKRLTDSFTMLPSMFKRLCLNAEYSEGEKLFTADMVRLCRQEFPKFIDPVWFDRFVKDRAISDISIAIGGDQGGDEVGADATTLVMVARYVLNPEWYSDELMAHIKNAASTLASLEDCPENQADIDILTGIVGADYHERIVLAFAGFAGPDDLNFPLRTAKAWASTVSSWMELYDYDYHKPKLLIENTHHIDLKAEAKQKEITLVSHAGGKQKNKNVVTPTAPNQWGAIKPLREAARLGLLLISKHHWCILEEMAIIEHDKDSDLPASPKITNTTLMDPDGNDFKANLKDNAIKALAYADMKAGERKLTAFNDTYVGSSI